MTMKELVFSLIYIIVCFHLSAQEGTICYEYKIQYGSRSAKDSIISLIGRKYYDNQNHLTKAVTLDPQTDDSCWEIRWYNKHGNVIKKLTKCSDTGVVGLLNYQYVYGEKGEIIQETSVQDKPFFEFTNTDYRKDSMVKKTYENKQKSLKGIFENKDVDVYNNFGKPIFSFQINNKGDTSSSKTYLYFPLSDTSKVRANISKYAIFHGKPIDVIIYLNAFNEEGIIDYYSNGKYYGSTIKTYNSKKKIVLEQYYNMIMPNL